MEDKIKALHVLRPDIHHIQLVYTPNDRPGWEAWQVIAYWNDESLFPYKMSKSAEGAIDNAIRRESIHQT